MQRRKLDVCLSSAHLTSWWVSLQATLWIDWCLQGSLFRQSLLKQEYQRVSCHLLSFNGTFLLTLTTAYFWEMRRKLATSAVCCPVRILLGREVFTWFHCSLPLSFIFFTFIFYWKQFSHLLLLLFLFLYLLFPLWVQRADIRTTTTTDCHTTHSSSSSLARQQNHAALKNTTTTTTTTGCVRCVYM